jgi:hypothetical protein
MSHAIAAMVRALRAHASELGLLYGQGGYVNKHHALVLSTALAPTPMATDYSVQAVADALLVLRAHKVGQQLVPAPARSACRYPRIIVLGCTAIGLLTVDS